MALKTVGRKAFLKHGVARKIARHLGVDEARVSAVVNGKDIPITEKGWRSYSRIQRAVAEAIGFSVEEAFSAEERGVQKEVAA